MQLSVKGIKKFYTESNNTSGTSPYKTLILDNVNFSISTDEDTGKIVSVLAPLGAGKSSLLKIIGSLVPPTEGTVILNGTEYKAADGKIVYIPEKPSSFPWYNVQENLEFVIKAMPDKAKSEIKNIISLVGLAGYEDHFPHNKSLGFRFRIALARALAVNPQLILIDDCFKNMQSDTQNELYSLIKQINEYLKINFLIATTSIHEAIILSDQIMLMKKNPGTIFKELQNTVKNNVADINSGSIALRNEIEGYFREEKIIDSVSFSI